MPATPLLDLTPRQTEVISLLSEGLTNKEIAQRLGISEEGVKAHVSRLLMRYRARNRVALVRLARADRNGDTAVFTSLSASVDEVRRHVSGAESVVHGDGAVASAGLSSVREEIGAQIGSLSPSAPRELRRDISTLRSTLASLELAVQLAAQLPAHARRGPLHSAIRTRVARALRLVSDVEASLMESTAPRRSPRRKRPN
jgi:DNA-binding CsgD family transcriptional regulator